jgi:hypothetical protein
LRLGQQGTHDEDVPKTPPAMVARRGTNDRRCARYLYSACATRGRKQSPLVLQISHPRRKIDMVTFIPIQGRSGQLVYVNPERINYIRTRNEKTVLYFDKDQAVELEQSIAEVRALRDPSTK